jgi:hypothetical protein
MFVSRGRSLGLGRRPGRVGGARVVDARWYAIKPKGMVGISAPACRSAISMPQGLEFAAARLVQVHTAGNDGTEWPMGPPGSGTG